MRKTILAIVMLAAATSAAGAQTKNKPTSGPFGTDWARPTSETGGYIYMDPRIQERRGGSVQRERARQVTGRAVESRLRLRALFL